MSDCGRTPGTLLSGSPLNLVGFTSEQNNALGEAAFPANDPCFHIRLGG